MEIQDIVALDGFKQEAGPLCFSMDMLEDARIQIATVMGFLGKKQKVRIDKELEEIGLTITQVQVLIYILRREKDKIPVTARDLEHYFRVKNSTMSGVLQRLEKKELIERVTDSADRRNKQIHIKGNLEELYTEVADRTWEEMVTTFRGFSQKELSTLLQLLLKLLRNIE